MMLQKKDRARAVKNKLGGGRFGALDSLYAWYPARPLQLTLARVVKLVDTGDLKSPGHCGRAGSSPAPGTIIYIIKTCIYGNYIYRILI